MSSRSRPPHGNKVVNTVLNVVLAVAAVVTGYLVFLAFTTVR